MQVCQQEGCSLPGIVCYDWPGRGVMFACFAHGKKAHFVLLAMAVDANLRYPDCSLCGGTGSYHNRRCPACVLIGFE